jgi:hypothetical protein
MATWGDFAAAEPELAEAVKRRFDAGVHKTIATLRRDGSPRISGTEADFVLGELWFGSMWGARKARDLQRDPRFALHTSSADPPGWDGDAKLSGRVEEVTDLDRFRAYQAARAGGHDAGANEAPARFHLFRAELAEVVVIGLNEARDRLVIEHWAEGRGVRRLERE